MDRVSIELVYGRDGETYHGVLSVETPPEIVVQEKSRRFEGYTFPRMMSGLAGLIRAHDECVVTLARLEVPESEYVMDAGTVDMLRTDPAAAISSMSHESRVVYVRDPGKQPAPPPRLLRAGHDTLAEAFGDHVYCIVNQRGQFECLGCGRWSTVTPTSMVCSNCELRMYGTTCGGSKWFRVRTADVLGKAHARYYLPRIWNPSGGWIKHDDLSMLFLSFTEERDNVQ